MAKDVPVEESPVEESPVEVVEEVEEAPKGKLVPPAIDPDEEVAAEPASIRNVTDRTDASGRELYPWEVSPS